MKLLLYSINYSPELTGIGKYNGELAHFLAGQNFETHVVTAPPYYPEWEIHSGHSNHWSKSTSSGITVYRCPLYVPKRVRTVKRLLHLVSFAITSGLRLLTLYKVKPDVLVMVQPTLFCAPLALFYSKLVGAKTILHVQDFEIDAMFGFGLAGGNNQKSKGFKRRLVYKIETWLMNCFDRVSTISHSMLEHAQNKGVTTEKLMYFPNWSNTGYVSPDVDGTPLKESWGYSAADKIILYSGNVGQKQGLDIVLEAASALRDQANVNFIIVGNGAYRDTLEAHAKAMGLTNVRFMPLQEWEIVPQMLSMADVHLVVQRKGSGSVLLPSKLTNILAVGGHAVVTAEEQTELGIIAKRHDGVYSVVDPGNLDAFVDALKTCLASDTSEPNLVARNYALNHLDREKVIGRFIKELKALVNDGEVVSSLDVSHKD